MYPLRLCSPSKHREGITSSMQMLRDLDPLFYGKEHLHHENIAGSHQPFHN